MVTNLRTILFAAPFLLIGLSAAIAVARMLQKKVPGTKWLCSLLIASAVWSLAQAAEYLSIELATKVFWDNLQWLGIVIIPPAYLLLTLDFTGLNRWARPLTILLMVVVPVLILALAYTNNIHHLFAVDYQLIEVSGFISMDKQYLIGYWIFLAYSYTLFIFGFFNLVWLSIRSPKHYGNQARWTLLAALVAVLISAFENGRGDWLPHFHATTLAMSSFTLVLAWYMSNLRNMDIRKASGNLLLASNPEPLFLLSDNAQIIDLNPAAQNLIGLTETEAVGCQLEQAAPELYPQICGTLQTICPSSSPPTRLSGSYDSYEAQIATDCDNFGRPHGHTLLLSTLGGAGKMAADVQRSNALVQALGKVAVQVAAVSSLEKVFNTMGEEIHGLSLEYAYISIDLAAEYARIDFASFKVQVLKPLEKLVGQSFIGFSLPLSAWPPIVAGLDDQYPVYVPNFSDAIQPAFKDIPDRIFRTGLGLVGVNSLTAGIFIPVKYSDGTSGIIVIWGETLQQQDLPAFSIFGSQIGSAIEQAHLLDMGLKQLQNVEHSNTLMHALNMVTTRASTSINPQAVLEILASELKKLKLEFYLWIIDHDQQTAKIQYASLNAKSQSQMEKIYRGTIVGFKLPRAAWPPMATRAVDTKKSIYVQDFASDAVQLFYKYPSKLARRGLKLFGINGQTSGLHIAQDLQDGTTSLLCIWGEGIQERDLPAFSTFASQVAIAFENARLYEAEQKQAYELERSNALLSTLSRITARLSSPVIYEDLLNAMKEEFSTLSLDFCYFQIDMGKSEAILKLLTINSDLLHQIQKMVAFRLIGRHFPQVKWPKEVIHAVNTHRAYFAKDFLDQLITLFADIPQKRINTALKLASITADTPGIFLPITLGDGSIFLIALWGEDLQKEDLPAFQVYTSQIESVLETSRLFQLAEKEILERRSAQKALLVSREEYRGLFENAHDAIIISDPRTGKILDANQRAMDIFGFSQNEFNQLNIEGITENVDIWRRTIAEILTSIRHYNFEIIQRRKDSQQMHMEVNAGIVIFQGKEAIQSIHRDVTERIEIEAKLRYGTLHDTLTDLPNRMLFEDRLSHAIDRSMRTQEYSYAVLFIDLDHFKNVNDSLGHISGDHLLVELSKRLLYSTRAADTIARMGGDEFVVLLEDVKSILEVTTLCERILENITKPFRIYEHELVISGSIGVVMGSPDYNSPEQYLRDADIAMYRAKAGGRARFDIFDITMRTSVLEQLQLENDLRRAVEEHEFFLVYQPIFSMPDQKLQGFEALIRWRQPGAAIIFPVDFIHAAENTGIIQEIGEWVLQEACSELQVWQDTYPQADSIHMNINISAVQLLNPGFPTDVGEFIKNAGIHPAKLAFEITETAFINDQEKAALQVAALKTLGVQIHLDDFGTGFSSLSFLNKFQIDAIKIERQFISGLKKEKQADLVRAIMAMSDRLSLRVIAEGIETQDQIDFLNDLGCPLGQGNYYSKPISPEEAGVLIAAR
jgi:diguanylate cyclase (GGDEF)-like protein/PAS domain S-box-containing protein